MEQVILELIKESPILIAFLAGAFISKKWYFDTFDAKLEHLEKTIEEIKVEIKELHKDVNSVSKEVAAFSSQLKTVKDFKGGVI